MTAFLLAFLPQGVESLQVPYRPALLPGLDTQFSYNKSHFVSSFR